MAMRSWTDGPFLIAAAPGAGKTRPALEYARELLKAGAVRRVAVVCPTTPLTRQWARAAARLGPSVNGMLWRLPGAVIGSLLSGSR